jgi:hypothetical protein
MRRHIITKERINLDHHAVTIVLGAGVVADDLGHWCLVVEAWIDYIVDWLVGNPKRRFDEYNNKFSLSYETEVYRSKRRKPNLRRWCLLALWHFNKGAVNDILLARLQLVATRNLHTTQPNTSFPTYDEVVNLTGLLETKGMSVLSGKQ